MHPGEKLCEEMSDSPQFRAHINSRISNIEHPVSTITTTLCTYTHTLYEQLLQHQPLEGMVEEVEEVVGMVVGRMSLQKPVSGVWSVLELQKSQQCALDEKVMYIIGLYNSVCKAEIN